MVLVYVLKEVKTQVSKEIFLILKYKFREPTVLKTPGYILHIENYISIKFIVV